MIIQGRVETEDSMEYHIGASVIVVLKTEDDCRGWWTWTAP